MIRSSFKDTVPTSNRLVVLMDLYRIGTFSELAKAIDVSPTTVSRWYYGDAIPSFENLLKLACYFDTTVDCILGKTDDSSSPVAPNNHIKSYDTDIIDYSRGTWCNRNKDKYISIRIYKDSNKPIAFVSRGHIRAYLNII